MSLVKISLTLFLFASGIHCMTVVLNFPDYIELGSEVTLECQYDPKPLSLSWVQWSFYGQEFFRYSTKDSPTKTASNNVTGIEVDLARSDEHNVTLRALSKDAGGLYACKVVAEGGDVLEADSVSRTIPVLTAEEIKKMKEMENGAGSQRSSVISFWAVTVQMILVTLAAYLSSRV